MSDEIQAIGGSRPSQAAEAPAPPPPPPSPPLQQAAPPTPSAPQDTVTLSDEAPGAHGGGANSHNSAGTGTHGGAGTDTRDSAGTAGAGSGNSAVGNARNPSGSEDAGSLESIGEQLKKQYEENLRARDQIIQETEDKLSGKSKDEIARDQIMRQIEEILAAQNGQGAGQL